MVYFYGAGLFLESYGLIIILFVLSQIDYCIFYIVYES
jgi:hypothetical protein